MVFPWSFGAQENCFDIVRRRKIRGSEGYKPCRYDVITLWECPERRWKDANSSGSRWCLLHDRYLLGLMPGNRRFKPLHPPKPGCSKVNVGNTPKVYYFLKKCCKQQCSWEQDTSFLFYFKNYNRKNIKSFFNVSLTVHFSIILVLNQLNAQILVL